MNLIAETTTKKGLTVQGDLDMDKYPKGIKISDKKFQQVNIARDAFHGEWNYTIQLYATCICKGYSVTDSN